MFKSHEKFHSVNGHRLVLIVDDEAINRFDKAYDELIGEEKPPILAENVTEKKKMSIVTDNLKLDILQEAAELVETKVIDGMEYFLIPVTDNVTVNGIRIRRKEGKE